MLLFLKFYGNDRNGFCWQKAIYKYSDRIPRPNCPRIVTVSVCFTNFSYKKSDKCFVGFVVGVELWYSLLIGMMLSHFNDVRIDAEHSS